MPQFAPLYGVFRRANRSARPATLGHFLASMDPALLELLALRFDSFHAETLTDAELEDLVLLAKNITEIEEFVSAEDTLALLLRLSRGVDSARFIWLGLLDAKVQDITLDENALATPTDLCVLALGGASKARGTVLH